MYPSLRLLSSCNLILFASQEELQRHLNESEHLKQEANNLFARGQYEEACEKWVDAIGALPPVEVEPEKEDTAPEQEEAKIRQLTPAEAEELSRELDNPDEDAQAVKRLQGQERELRTTLWSNVAEARLRLVSWRWCCEK